MDAIRGISTGLVSVLIAGGAAAAQARCDEHCLDRLMDRYLTQLVRHDPEPLPVAANVNARENGKAVRLGEGSWREITSLPRPGLTFADPTLGQVVYIGAVDRGDQLGALLVRLRVADGRIVESEMFTRGGEPGGKQDFSGMLEPDVLYDAVVPEKRRSDRQGLRQVVERYEEGISRHDGTIAPFSYRCDRYSAGFRWTNNPANPPERGGGTCATSMNGLRGQAVVNSRIAVLDVPRGIAVAMFVIPHGERAVKGATNVAEVFKIVDGKIRSIEEFSFPGPYPPDSGFPDE
jgi:hypothetical protein